MLALAADENFDNRIIRGLFRRNQTLDLIRVQDVGLIGAADPVVLAWAAEAHRMLLTHDVSTMVQHACDRIAAGLPMPGLIECPKDLPIGIAISEVRLIAECSI